MSRKHDFAGLMEEREQSRQAQLEQLRQRIRAGIDSGPGIPAEEAFDRPGAKCQAMAQA